MEFDKRHGYILQWLIGIGDLVVLNLMFLLVYVLLDSMYTRAIANNLREVLLCFCPLVAKNLNHSRMKQSSIWFLKNVSQN